MEGVETHRVRIELKCIQKQIGQLLPREVLCVGQSRREHEPVRGAPAIAGIRREASFGFATITEQPQDGVRTCP